MAMMKKFNQFEHETSPSDLRHYVEQKAGFSMISTLCAGTVHYQKNLFQITSILPSKNVVTQFNEKEMERLKEKPEEVSKLKTNLVKKHHTHDAITK